MINLMVSNVLSAVLIILSVILLVCMVKAIKGPRIADRVVCVNMMGTIVIIMVAVLAIKLDEGYLADISLIYAMISFLAVVVLCRICMGVYLERQHKGSKDASDNSIAGENDAMAASGELKEGE